MKDLLDQGVRLTLTTNEMITIQAALKVAREQEAVTIEHAASAAAKLDAAIDRWAGVYD